MRYGTLKTFNIGISIDKWLLDNYICMHVILNLKYTIRYFEFMDISIKSRPIMIIRIYAHMFLVTTVDADIENIISNCCNGLTYR